MHKLLFVILGCLLLGASGCAQEAPQYELVSDDAKSTQADFVGMKNSSKPMHVPLAENIELVMPAKDVYGYTVSKVPDAYRLIGFEYTRPEVANFIVSITIDDMDPSIPSFQNKPSPKVQHFLPPSYEITSDNEDGFETFTPGLTSRIEQAFTHGSTAIYISIEAEHLPYDSSIEALSAAQEQYEKNKDVFEEVFSSIRLIPIP